MFVVFIDRTYFCCQPLHQDLKSANSAQVLHLMLPVMINGPQLRDNVPKHPLGHSVKIGQLPITVRSVAWTYSPVRKYLFFPFGSPSGRFALHVQKRPTVKSACAEKSNCDCESSKSISRTHTIRLQDGSYIECCFLMVWKCLTQQKLDFHRFSCSNKQVSSHKIRG